MTVLDSMDSAIAAATAGHAMRANNNINVNDPK